MFAKSWLILLFCCVLAIKSEDVSEKTPQYSSHIDAVLKYLDENPNKLYNYKQGSFVSAQQKADIVEITTDVDVECVNKYPEVPCSEHVLTCHGFVRENPEQNQYQVLSDVICRPKIEIEIENDDGLVPPAAVPVGDVAADNFELSHEQVSTEQGADFVAVRRDRVPSLGSPYDLNTDAEGVDELVHTAIQHVESERNQRHSLVKVLRLQQQIVAGVKYILLLELAPTVCSKDADISCPCPVDNSAGTSICQVTYITKPWISKAKHIIQNNCTKSQEYTDEDVQSQMNDIDNEIDSNRPYGKPYKVPEEHDSISNYDKIAEHGIMDPAAIADLESQILFDDALEPPTPQVVSSSLPETAESIRYEAISRVPSAYASLPAVEEREPVTVFEQYEPVDVQQAAATEQAGGDKNLTDNTEGEDEVQVTTDNTEEESTTTDVLPETVSSLDRYHRAKRNTDNSDSSSSSSSSEENETKRKSKKDDDSTDDDKKADNKQDDSSSSSSSSEENKREKSGKQDDNDNKSDSSSSSSSEENTAPRPKRSVGKFEKITLDEKALVRNLAEYAAASLDDIDDDNQKRVVLQILGAKKLVLDGTYYHIILRLGVSHCLEHEYDEKCKEKLITNLTKICKVQIHVDNDFGNPKVVKSQCQNIKRDENDKNRTHYSRYRRGLPGGVSEMALDDPRIKEFVSSTLTHLDSSSEHDNKYKIVKVNSATSQVVAGSKYVINADIALSKCKKGEEKSVEECDLLENAETKNCVITIWDRVWLNKRETKVKCGNEIDATFQGTSRRSKRSISNEGIEDTEEYSKVRKYLKTALKYLQQKNQLGKQYIIKNIERVSKQTVAGELYRINAHVAQSDCQDGCMEIEGSDVGCELKAWNRPWLPVPLQLNITCADDNIVHSFLPGVDNFQKKNLESQFQDFVSKHRRVYANKREYLYRLKVFRDNLNTIDLLNKYEQGTATYGVTQFADMTQKEFSKSRGLRWDLKTENEVPFAQAEIPDIELPDEFDWRDKAAVTEVKNQGMCGSCWAFSVTGDVEGQYAIKHGKLLSFSEQELVDCDKTDDGCSGGLMDNAYRAIEKLGGLELESDYPYEGDNEKCHFNKSKVEVRLTGALNISHNETDMAKWLVQNGPISIAINANAMQFYMGGVSHPWKMLCSPKNLDHGVLIVGYGVHNYPKFKKSLPYWIVKNSWGKSWGEQGYYRVYRGDGTCGLNQTPSSAIVA